MNLHSSRRVSQAPFKNQLPPQQAPYISYPTMAIPYKDMVFSRYVEYLGALREEHKAQMIKALNEEYNKKLIMFS